uniref:LysR substrate-binding domain-containing protein n=1 Tax=Streptomyces scabiei TaxID=1930 RepID=UPI0038F6A210
MEAAQGAIDALQHVVTGSVRLSIPTGLGELYLADMLLAFQKRHPQVRIRVLFSNRVSDPVSAQVDVAVRVARDVQEHLVA